MAALPQQVELRELSYRHIPGGPGVDVGCGLGRAVADLTDRGVPACGVDRSQLLVEAAHQRYPSQRFSAADAAALPFADGTLQWYRAERVYQHLLDPVAALTEAKRVLAGGGKVIVVDLDYESLIITSTDPHTTRRLIDALVEDVPYGRIGRHLPGLMAEAGLTDVTFSLRPMEYTDLDVMREALVEPAAAAGIAAGLVTTAQAEAWLADLDDLVRTNRFMLAYMAFVVVGSVPLRP